MRLLTPPGVAGVAVVLVLAEEREAALACLKTRNGAPWPHLPPGVPRLAMLEIDGTSVDEVLVVSHGNGTTELHLHGSPAVLATLRRRFVVQPASLPMEPADRLLLEALGPEQLELALEQRQWSFRGFLLELAAMSGSKRQIAMDEALQRSRAALAHVVPARLVLAGAQNAGKSTLFNRLLFRERVLTGPMPGLTRDAVAEQTTLAGYPYELVDTAGEGPCEAEVDREAIEVGRALRAAGHVLLVVDASRGPSVFDRELAERGAFVVANKVDLPAAPWPADMPCHLRTSCLAAGADTLRNEVGELLRASRRLPVAGRVGGPAALDRQQLADLAVLRTSAEL